jgi:hypothetical protein
LLKVTQSTSSLNFKLMDMETFNASFKTNNLYIGSKYKQIQ